MKNKFGVCSIIIGVLCLICLFIPVDTVNVVKIISIVSLVLSLIGVVLGIIGKKYNKKTGIIGIIICLLMFVLSGFMFAGTYIIDNLSNCTLIDEDTASCEMLGEEIEVPVEVLREDQFSEE